MHVKKAFVLWTLLFVSLLTSVEVLSYFYFTNFSERYTFLTAHAVHPARIPVMRGIYDASLGWDSRYIDMKGSHHGERPRISVQGPDLVSTYGDSYTHGDEVGHFETWQHYLANHLGKGVINFGVGGYGTDQSLLRFRQKQPEVHTPFAMLGITTENINRIVNVYRKNYYPETGIPFTKPRFTLKNGELSLIDNPIRSEQDLILLSDESFLIDIGKDDYWSNSRYPTLKFPYMRLWLSQSIWRESLHGRDSEVYSHHTPDLWKDEETVQLMVAIIDAFVKEGRGMNTTPVIAVLPNEEEWAAAASGEKVLGIYIILTYCEEQNIHCINPSNFYPSQLGKDVEGLFLESGHYSPEGNQAIASTIHSYFIQQGWLNEI